VSQFGTISSWKLDLGKISAIYRSHILERQHKLRDECMEEYYLQHKIIAVL
jgi:hypothetical protein